MLTEKEKLVLGRILAESDFNGDRIDITKTWGEQFLEDEEMYQSFVTHRRYGYDMEKQAFRGIIGSLAKKNLIEVWYDEDDRIPWIFIREKHFNNIVKEYAGL